MNLPVPYRPGDILEVGCAPYVSKPDYCILTEVGEDCCDVQCLYPCEDGCIKFGALKHGRYFFSCYYASRYISLLYGTRVYAGELPRECEFMERLSEKLHKEPEFGKTLWQVWNYLDFCLPDE